MPDQSLDEILSIIDGIPEQMCGGLQPRFLYELSHATQGMGAIVEIGTCAGKSTIALAYGQQVKQNEAAGDDKDSVNPMPTSGARVIHTIDIAEHPDVTANLKRAGVSDFVTRTIKASSKAADDWHGDIELLFIDADHRYNGIVSDIRHWCRFVVPGGKVALHDYPGFEHVNDTWKAVHRHLLSRPNVWRVAADREAGSIIVFERIKTDEQALLDEPTIGSWLKWKINNGKWYLDELWNRLKG